jgi:hypothetical protein
MTVTVEWLKPDGFTTSPLEVKLDPGVQTVHRRLEWAYDGNRAANGDVVLHVLPPVDISSQPQHHRLLMPIAARPSLAHAHGAFILRTHRLDCSSVRMQFVQDLISSW